MTPGSGWQCHPDLVRGEPCRYDGAMRDIDQAKRVRLLLAIFLPACLLVLGGFYALMFQRDNRSEEHTSELQSLMRISYAVFCLKKKTPQIQKHKSHVTV